MFRQILVIYNLFLVIATILIIKNLEKYFSNQKTWIPNKYYYEAKRRGLDWGVIEESKCNSFQPNQRPKQKTIGKSI